MIQCACFCLNYLACKSSLCAPRLSHHLWVCGLSFSAAFFAIPSQTAWLGGGDMKCVFQSSLQLVLENVAHFSVLLQTASLLFPTLTKLNFLEKKWRKSSIQHFVKIRPVGAELFQCTDRHGKANSRHSATLGTRLHKTWVNRTGRHVPQTVMLPVTSFLSHNFITSSLSTANITFNTFPLQTLSFRQPTESVHLAQTKHVSIPLGGATTSFRWTDGDKRSCWLLKADSHIACRAHSVPLPCLAAKGLEWVFPIWFTQCGRVLFTLAMPRSDHALLKATAQCRRRETACGRPARYRLLPATKWSSRKFVIWSLLISDACGQCKTKQRWS